MNDTDLLIYQEPTPKEIRVARAVTGMSVTDVADMMNVNRHTWWRWERGKNKMPSHVWALFMLMTDQATLTEVTEDGWREVMRKENNDEEAR